MSKIITILIKTTDKFLFISLICLTLIPIKVKAQDTLDLENLIHLALKRNPDFLIQKGNERIADLEQKQALTSFLPQLDAEASYIYTKSIRNTPYFVAANGAQEKIAWLGLRQSIFQPDKLNNYAERKIYNKKELNKTVLAKQDLIASVIATYFSALKAEDEIKVYKENLKLLRLIFKQSKTLYNNGIVPEIDIKKSQIEYLLEQNSLFKTERKYLLIINQLKKIIGEKINNKIKIKPFKKQAVRLDSLKIYELEALKNNIELKIQQSKIELASAEKRYAVLSQLPSINAYLFYGWDSNDPFKKSNLGWQAAIEIKLPLWHWGAQKANVQIAGIHYYQKNKELKNLEKQIIQNVVSAYTEAKLQYRQIKAMKESKKIAAEALKMARIGYQQGVYTNLELLNTQKLNIESELSYSNAIYDFFIAKVHLFKIIGKLQDNLSWLKQ